MWAGQLDDLAPPGSGQAAYCSHQQRAGRERFHVAGRVGQPDKNIPEVIDQGDEGGHDPWPLHIMGHKPAQAPLVLELVEYVLQSARSR
jgi:hypothetical protein